MNTYSKEFKKILAAIPDDNGIADWAALEATRLGFFFEKMSQTPQNRLHHGEGDVYTHTKMVCEQLVKLPEYKNTDNLTKQILFIGALLHDIRKPFCTVITDDNISSHSHARIGARIARELHPECHKYHLTGARNTDRSF